MGRRICATCGHGATERLLENLKEEAPKPKTNRKPPPGRKTNAVKAQEWARAILRKQK